MAVKPTVLLISRDRFEAQRLEWELANEFTIDYAHDVGAATQRLAGQPFDAIVCDVDDDPDTALAFLTEYGNRQGHRCLIALVNKLSLELQDKLAAAGVRYTQNKPCRAPLLVKVLKACVSRRRREP